MQWRVRHGVAELLDSYMAHGLGYEEFACSWYVRLRRIRKLLAVGEVDERLRRW